MKRLLFSLAFAVALFVPLVLSSSPSVLAASSAIKPNSLSCSNGNYYVDGYRSYTTSPVHHISTGGEMCVTYSGNFNWAESVTTGVKGDTGYVTLVVAAGVGEDQCSGGAYQYDFGNAASSTTLFAQVNMGGTYHDCSTGHNYYVNSQHYFYIDPQHHTGYGFTVERYNP